MTDPHLPVSDQEYNAATQTRTLEFALAAAHAVLVPKIERALEAALKVYAESAEYVGSSILGPRARAAFWRAMGET